MAEHVDVSSNEDTPLTRGPTIQQPARPMPTTSMYALTRKEIAKGIANRFVHSRTYIFFYLGMAALSVTTVVLSMTDGCPGLAFYILEIVINTAMILEVSIRFVALGRQFWKSSYNIFDLILTFFCVLTLLVIVFAGCGRRSKEEEVLDTLLLVARNVLQFGRLAAVMRQSGQSIFSQPKPIDITTARRAGFDMDFDDEDDEDRRAIDAELGQPLIGARDTPHVLFDAGSEQRPPFETTPMPHAVHAAQTRDQEDVWAELG